MNETWSSMIRRVGAGYGVALEPEEVDCILHMLVGLLLCLIGAGQRERGELPQRRSVDRFGRRCL